ncbi:hypothetical protein GOP47_0018075 [Adiantum capillus-veneris]|uniref:Uncharacterized protein n=1 Tax=Adiantum capillus-veneris TaxID=13818 RepID=A0A9D4UH31_ADICA|nr:hypothetical protein GOP47_0018075 [Adiantum capillus-veneris]
MPTSTPKDIHVFLSPPKKGNTPPELHFRKDDNLVAKMGVFHQILHLNFINQKAACTSFKKLYNFCQNWWVTRFYELESWIHVTKKEGQSSKTPLYMEDITLWILARFCGTNLLHFPPNEPSSSEPDTEPKSSRFSSRQLKTSRSRERYISQCS